MFGLQHGAKDETSLSWAHAVLTSALWLPGGIFNSQKKGKFLDF
jgi:hypothetical protein